MVGKWVWVILPFYLFTFLPSHATDVTSPNGNIVLTFSVEDGRPTYSLTYKGREVVRPSHLGFELAKDKHATLGIREQDLMDGFFLVKETTSTFDETWQPVWGETRDIRNHYNELCVTLHKEFMMPREHHGPVPEGIHERPAVYLREMVLRFRVYDDGIGFRYEFPQQHSLSYFLI
ncbi:MAG: glycoside hydrolase family 97 N-terminal domain-containing protein, partial [Prevotella sp.]|nr:glycoside hydrolase family 97 N-terminal domain-containing protein [Prevotella sp.]